MFSNVTSFHFLSVTSSLLIIVLSRKAGNSTSSFWTDPLPEVMRIFWIVRDRCHPFNTKHMILLKKCHRRRLIHRTEHFLTTQRFNRPQRDQKVTSTILHQHSVSLITNFKKCSNVCFLKSILVSRIINASYPSATTLIQ